MFPASSIPLSEVPIYLAYATTFHRIHKRHKINFLDDDGRRERCWYLAYSEIVVVVVVAFPSQAVSIAILIIREELRPLQR